MDSGVAVATIIIFFALQYPKVEFIDWWGNRVYNETYDARGKPQLPVPSGGFWYVRGFVVQLTVFSDVSV